MWIVNWDSKREEEQELGIEMVNLGKKRWKGGLGQEKWLEIG